MTVEDKQAEIIRLTLANPGYSHAERVLERMVAYSQELDVEQALDRLRAEVIDELADDTPDLPAAAGGTGDACAWEHRAC